MKLTIDVFTGGSIKRGDIVETNVGDPRERTCIVLRVHRSRRSPKGVPRFVVWCERWWQMETELRIRLFRSAERAGGQEVIFFERYRSKPKRRILGERGSKAWGNRIRAF